MKYVLKTYKGSEAPVITEHLTLVEALGYAQGLSSVSLTWFFGVKEIIATCNSTVPVTMFMISTETK